MVIKRAIHHLKTRPKDERTAVAGGIATAVSILLFIGWMIFLLRGAGESAIQAAPPAEQKTDILNVQQTSEAQRQFTAVQDQ